jgi:hypothetical protein
LKIYIPKIYFGIITSFIFRLLSGLLPLSVIFYMEKSSNIEATAIYIYMVGLAAIVSSFTQGYMPVYFASIFESNTNTQRKEVVVSDYLLSIIVLCIFSVCLYLIASIFDFTLLTDSFFAYVLVSFSYSNFNAVAKYSLNENGINQYLFYSAALPSLVALITLFVIDIINLEFNLYYVCLALLLSSFYILLQYFKKYRLFNMTRRKFFFEKRNLKERILRGLLTIVEQLDVVILALVGFNELVFFAYIKRVMGVGSTASSIITKTFEKRLIKKDVTKTELDMIRNFIAFFQFIFVIFIFTIAFVSKMDYLGLLLAAGLISIAQVFVSGKVVTTIMDDIRAKKAIIRLIILLSIIFTYFYFSEQTVIDFCLVFIIANFGKVLILSRVS